MKTMFHLHSSIFLLLAHWLFAQISFLNCFSFVSLVFLSFFFWIFFFLILCFMHLPRLLLVVRSQSLWVIITNILLLLISVMFIWMHSVMVVWLFSFFLSLSGVFESNFFFMWHVRKEGVKNCHKKKNNQKWLNGIWNCIWKVVNHFIVIFFSLVVSIFFVFFSVRSF